MGEAKRRKQLDLGFGKPKKPFQPGNKGGITSSHEEMAKLLGDFFNLRPWTQPEYEGFVAAGRLAVANNLTLNVHLFKDGVCFCFKDLRIGNGLELTSHMHENITARQWEAMAGHRPDLVPLRATLAKTGRGE